MKFQFGTSVPSPPCQRDCERHSNACSHHHARRAFISIPGGNNLGVLRGDEVGDRSNASLDLGGSLQHQTTNPKQQQQEEHQQGACGHLKLAWRVARGLCHETRRHKSDLNVQFGAREQRYVTDVLLLDEELDLSAP
jgi:hypothetical protein